MRIILFQGVYDTLDLFTEELDTAFKELGYSTFTVHTATQKADMKVLSELVKEPCAVVTFNNLGYNLELEKGKNVWEQYGIPYVNILMDHPFHYDRPLLDAPETSLVFCIDRNHVSYIRQFFPNIHKTAFLPHAGCGYFLKNYRKKVGKVDNLWKMSDCSDENSAIPVLYAGSLSKYKIERLIPDFSRFQEFDAAGMSGEILKDLAEHPWKTTEQSIEEHLKEIGLKVGETITEQELGSVIARLRFIDGYAVSFFREQAVRILVDSGIPVMVYGDDWEKCDWSDNPNLHIGGKVLAPEILPLMCRSKIVLNTMTWFKDGTHDRVFNGMLSGAAVVTDPSGYMKENFKDGQELRYFELNRLRELPEIVTELLENEDRRRCMAEAGQKKAEEFHTWKNRAEEIVKFLKAGTT